MVKKIVLSSIPSDSHTWNLVYIQFVMEELGYDVINLGCCTPIKFLLTQLREYQPYALVISTINGHGHIEGVKIANAIKQESQLSYLKILMGGKIGTIGKQNDRYVQKLIEAGFDQVFVDENAIHDFKHYLTMASSA